MSSIHARPFWYRSVITGKIAVGVFYLYTGDDEAMAKTWNPSFLAWAGPVQEVSFDQDSLPERFRQTAKG